MGAIIKKKFKVAPSIVLHNKSKRHLNFKDLSSWLSLYLQSNLEIPSVQPTGIKVGDRKLREILRMQSMWWILPIFIFLPFLWKGGEVKVTQLCPTLCDLMDYTVHGILQARMLEWVAVPFSRGFSQPRDRIQVFHITGGLFTTWTTREALWKGGDR